MHRTSCAL